MSDTDTIAALWFTPLLNYGAIALGQILVVYVGSMIHADVKLSSPKLQQCFHSHSQAMCCFAVVMALAELYASIIVASVDGPFIVIPWLFIAQLFVTLLYFYLPYNYYDMEVEEEERVRDEEKMFLMMDDDEDLDRFLCDPPSPSATVVSTPSIVSDGDSGYGSMSTTSGGDSGYGTMGGFS
ncbi:hypothetical protein FSPOR_5660 [Fusarium sporotrichioides]|uniref:Uncharacterized protein n=1 Tax=Fusarium sporotrichioides TaxID=5514 RepID=A0A395S6F7_FUSSP|nr:hypothetical protein FSPOR_5660 [Fusarium sporotrichioides]